MKNLNNYIVEKLKISKNVNSDIDINDCINDICTICGVGKEVDGFIELISKFLKLTKVESLDELYIFGNVIDRLIDITDDKKLFKKYVEADDSAAAEDIHDKYRLEESFDFPSLIKKGLVTLYLLKFVGPSEPSYYVLEFTFKHANKEDYIMFGQK